MGDHEWLGSFLAGAASLPSVKVRPERVWNAIHRRQIVRIAGTTSGLAAVAASIVMIVSIALPGSDAAFDSNGSANSAGRPGPASSPCADADGCLGAGPPGWTLDAQELVMPYLERIDEIGLQSEGYGGSHVLYEPLKVEVYWHGSMPAAAMAVVADAQAAGVIMEQIDAPFGGEMLLDASSVLAAKLDEMGIYIRTVGPAPGFTGLEISGPEVSDDQELQSRVREIARGLVGEIPLSFVADPGPASNLELPVDPPQH